MNVLIPLGLGEMILDAIIHGISIIIWYVGALLNQLLDLVYDMLEIFSGMSYVKYNGEEMYLISVFFNNTTINNIYWGMVAIGMVLTMGFAIWSVVKKFFDSGDKVKASYMDILVATFKAILLMCLMGAIVTATIDISNVVLEQIAYVFNNADDLGKEDTITFDDSDYATMFRILNTIGNYSLNPSRNTRYNVNCCFNDIRNDLQILDKKDMFSFDYTQVKTVDAAGNSSIETVTSWQSAITKIANSHSLLTDLNVDQYYPTVADAIEECMDLIQNDPSFGPLQSNTFTRSVVYDANDINPGVIVMLAASMNAGNVDLANKSMSDTLRKPYLYGEKDIYDLDECEEGFNIDLGHWDHIIAILGAYFLIKEFAAAVLNCVARLFNMVLLYLIAPLVISVYPLDDGGKFKQWSVSFIVQSFSVFGTIIAIRVMMTFIPIIMSDTLVLFPNFFMNICGKIILIMGAALTVEKAGGLITGILSDQAGFASVQAGNIGDAAKGAVSAGKALAGGVASAALGHAATATGLSTLGDKVSSGAAAAGDAMRQKGGILGALFGGGGKDSGDKGKDKDKSKDKDSKGSKDKDKDNKEPKKDNSGGDKDKGGGGGDKDKSNAPGNQNKNGGGDKDGSSNKGNGDNPEGGEGDGNKELPQGLQPGGGGGAKKDAFDDGEDSE